MEIFASHGVTPITIVIAIAYIWSEIKTILYKGKNDDKRLAIVEEQVSDMKVEVNTIKNDLHTFKNDFHTVKNALNNLIHTTAIEARKTDKQQQMIFVGLQLLCKEKNIDLKSFNIDSNE